MRAAGIIARPQFDGRDAEGFELFDHLIEAQLAQ
jgi:hypothetical protein